MKKIFIACLGLYSSSCTSDSSVNRSAIAAGCLFVVVILFIGVSGISWLKKTDTKIRDDLKDNKEEAHKIVSEKKTIFETNNLEDIDSAVNIFNDYSNNFY